MKKFVAATWSNLPEELLEIIGGKLTCFLDYVRFGAVCRSWQSTMVNMHHHLTSRDPWLLLPEREDNIMICEFYNLSKGNVFELRLPEAHAKRCVGSSKGWLVMVDESLYIHLFNPCTRVQYQLPHQLTFLGQNHFTSVGWRELHIETRDFFIIKVVLSSSPSNSDYIAMAIYSSGQRGLAIARPGDGAWTTIPYNLFQFCDVIYYKEQFYAISWAGVVVSCDVGAHPKTTVFTAPVREQDVGQYYLVECSGELLQVRRQVEYEYGAYNTVGFTVFKLDSRSNLWVEMKSLGDQSLFLGYNTSFSFSCDSSGVTGVKRDCIYFTDDDVEEHEVTLGGGDMGVFHLEDGHIEPHYPGDARHLFSLFIWFTPNK